MTCLAKLQDALQETVVAVGDEIKLLAHEMWRQHDAREYAWDVESAAVVEQLTQDIDDNIKLQTEELQKLDEARECAWDVDRAAAAGGNEPPGSKEQLEERPTRSTHELRWRHCWVERQDAWDADCARMTEQQTEHLKDLMAQSRRMCVTRLSELEEKAEEYEAELKSLREALDKVHVICDGCQDPGDDCDTLRARLQQVESQVTAVTKQLDPLAQMPERIEIEILSKDCLI